MTMNFHATKSLTQKHGKILTKTPGLFQSFRCLLHQISCLLITPLPLIRYLILAKRAYWEWVFTTLRYAVKINLLTNIVLPKIAHSLKYSTLLMVHCFQQLYFMVASRKGEWLCVYYLNGPKISLLKSKWLWKYV